MHCFTRIDRTYNGYYVKTPGRCFGYVVEMRPLWLDETTLQVALSEYHPWNDADYFPIQARLANVRNTMPELAKALRWCAERRLAASVVCVEGAMNDRLVGTLQNWQVSHGGNAADYMLAPNRRFASHQLRFKSWDRAFQFRVAWC